MNEFKTLMNSYRAVGLPVFCIHLQNTMVNKRHTFFVVFFLLFQLQIICPLPCLGGWLDDTFIDPSDGKLDLSNWLLEKDGLFPAPIIITEPAIGYGGGLALVYFHDKIGSRKGSPPSVSAIAGAATENGTWFVGGGHMGIWKNDTIRYTGGLGTAVVNMDYYGRSGNHGTEGDEPVHFETDAVFLTQELQFRIRESNFFTGFGYTLADTQNHFDLTNDNLPEDFSESDFDRRSAAMHLLLSYDSRNNLFTPSSGIASEVKAMFFDDIWGSDDDFQKYSAFLLSYTPLTDSLILGARAAGKRIDGDAPFYSYPFIDMRGVKAMQYQGQMTLLGELELRWSFSPRWALVGFGGAGKAYNEGEREDSDIIFSKGVGLRYLIASKLGLQVGFDIAHGPDNTAIYLQFGSSWALK